MTFEKSIDLNNKMNRMLNSGFETPLEVDTSAILRMVNDSPSSAIREQTSEIRDMYEQQLKEVVESNKKLQELCDIKTKEAEEAKADAKKAKREKIVSYIITAITIIISIIDLIFSNG